MADDFINNLDPLVAGAHRASVRDMARSRLEDSYARSQDMRWQTQQAIQRAQGFAAGLPNTAAANAGSPFSPFNALGTVASASQLTQQYASLSAQSRALLGGQFNEGRVQGMGPALEAFGANKQDLISYMSQLATLSMKVSQNLDVATRSVMTFAKANGLDQGQMVATVGMAVRSSSMTTDQGFDYLSRVRTLAGSNAAVPEYAAAAQMLFSQANAAGVMANPSGTLSLMNGFQNLNPLYRQNPGLVSQMTGQLQGSEQSMLLGFSINAAARLGRSTDLLDVMSYAQNPNDKEFHGEVVGMVGRNRGLSTALALSGQLPANLLKDFLRDPDAIKRGSVPTTGDYTLDKAEKDAAGATTTMQGEIAKQIDNISNNSNWIKTIGETVASIATKLGATGNVVTGALTGAAGAAIGILSTAKAMQMVNAAGGVKNALSATSLVEGLGGAAALGTAAVAGGVGILAEEGLTRGYDAYVTHREAKLDAASDANMKAEVARIKAARRKGSPAVRGDVTMMDRDPSKLNPAFADTLSQIFDTVRAQGYDPAIAEGFRTQERQNYLVTKGPDVTRTAHSLHTRGDAADVMDRSNKPGFQEALWAAERAHGLEPIGTWDPMHVQMKTSAAAKTDGKTAEKLLQAAGMLVDASTVFKTAVDSQATRRPGYIR